MHLAQKQARRNRRLQTYSAPRAARVTCSPRRDVYAQTYFRPHHSLLEYSPVLQYATRDEDMSGRFWSHLVSANALQSPCHTDQSCPSQSRAHGKPSFSASRLRSDTTINTALRAHIQLVITERVVGASL